ncbi:hypothetical protein D3C83_01500 [compost metagenome]
MAIDADSRDGSTLRFLLALGKRRSIEPRCIDCEFRRTATRFGVTEHRNRDLFRFFGEEQLQPLAHHGLLLERRLVRVEHHPRRQRPVRQIGGDRALCKLVDFLLPALERSIQ